MIIQGNTRMEKYRQTSWHVSQLRLKGGNGLKKRINYSFQLKSSVLCNISENMSSGKMKRVLFCLLELDVKKKYLYGKLNYNLVIQQEVWTIRLNKIEYCFYIFCFFNLKKQAVDRLLTLKEFIFMLNLWFGVLITTC